MISARAESVNYGPLLVLLSAVCFSTTGTAQALAPAGAQPVIIGTMRLVVGSIAMVLLALIQGKFRDGRPWPRLNTLLAAVAIVFFQASFFGACARTGVTVGTVVTMGFCPVMGGVLGWLMHRETPPRRWYPATFLAVAGLALLSVGGNVRTDPVGIALAVVAGTSYAAYAAFSKTLVRDHSPVSVMAVLFSIGALLMSPLLFINDIRWMASPHGAIIVTHLGIIATAAAYTLFLWGLSTTPVSTGTTLALAEPLIAALLGIFFLGEPLTSRTALGIALIFCGMVLLARRAGKRHC